MGVSTTDLIGTGFAVRYKESCAAAQAAIIELAERLTATSKPASICRTMGTNPKVLRGDFFLMTFTKTLLVAALTVLPTAVLASAPVPAPLAGAFGPLGLVAAGAAYLVYRRYRSKQD